MRHINPLSFILLSLLSIPVLGQKPAFKTENLISTSIIKLKEKGVDTILVYHEYCIGCHIPSKKVLEESSTIYLFYIKNGQTFITKKNPKKTYYNLKKIKVDFWKSIFENKQVFKDIVLKEPSYKLIVNGKEDTVKVRTAHSEFTYLKLVLKSQIFEKTIDSFYFVKEVNEHNNVNYQYNYSSYINTFQTGVKELVKKLELGFAKKL